MESFEYRGLWWLPESPENKIAGNLTFSQEKGFLLDIIGALKPYENGLMSLSQHSIILGVTTGSKKITLQNCMQVGHSISIVETSKYIANIGFVGIHIDNEEDLLFDKIQARYTYLYDWVGISGIEREFFPEDRASHTLKYSAPEDIEIQTHVGNIRFTFIGNTEGKWHIHNFSESTWIALDANKEKTFDEIAKDFLFPFKALITLGTTNANFIEELYFFKKDYSKYPIKVYYRQSFYHQKVKEKLFPNDMLFTLSDIYEGIESRINNWLNISEKIDSVLNLFLRYKVSTRMFQELKFLTISQAIETYHRRVKDNKILSEEDHQDKVEEILNNVSAEDKIWLKKILEHTNEPRLTDRIKGLLIEHKIILNPVIENLSDGNKKRNSFTSLAVRSRNFYTHYDKEDELKPAKGENLFWLTEKLSILLQSCLLSELGVNAEERLNLFRENSYYNHLTTKN
jgi:hypothetical protein